MKVFESRLKIKSNRSLTQEKQNAEVIEMPNLSGSVITRFVSDQFGKAGLPSLGRS